MEYKATGWKLEPDGKHITFTDGMGIGTLRLIGKKGKIETYPIKQIKRVRLVKRADGYYVQFAVKADRQIDHQPTGKQVGIDVGLKVLLHRLGWQDGGQPALSAQSRKAIETPPSARLEKAKAFQEPQDEPSNTWRKGI